MKNKLHEAYRTLVLKNAEKSMSSEFLSTEDYLYLVEDDELFLDLIEITGKNRSAHNIIGNYFNINKSRKDDIMLGGKVLERLYSSNCILMLLEFFPIEKFEKNLELMEKAIRNSEGYLLYHENRDRSPLSPYLRGCSEIRDKLTNMDKFSLAWFDLPTPKDKELTIKLLEKNFDGFYKLNEEQKKDIDYVLASISGYGKNHAFHDVSLNDFYDNLDYDLKIDSRVCLTLIAKGFYELIPEAFLNDGLVTSCLNNEYRDPNRSGYGVLNNNYLEEINTVFDPKIFKYNKVVLEFFKWTKDNVDFISKIDKTYEVYYRAMKSISTENKYVAKRFKEVGTWRVCSLAEINRFNKQKYEEFFIKNIPDICTEMQSVVLDEKIKNKSSITVSKKVKI